MDRWYHEPIMRAILLVLIMSMAYAHAFAQPALRLVPPSGATFAPGQRFDVRLEADEIAATDNRYTLQINGREATAEVFSGQEFATFPLLDNMSRPSNRIGGGVTRRQWSFARPGHYVLSAELIGLTGTRLTAQSTIEVLPLTAERTRARNIILFIGDGMGVGQRTAARIASRGIENGKARGLLEMDQLDTYGFVMTSSLDALVTDSSPGAATHATGNKSINNAHGVFADNTGPAAGIRTTFEAAPPGRPSNTDPELTRLFFDNPRVENIAELLRRTRGMATGVVSTVSLADSTPASFSSHSFSRFAQAGIAEQVVAASGHTVVLGAGGRFFLPAGHDLLGNIPSGRGDTRNLVEESQEAGYAFVSTATELARVGKPQKLLGLFHASDMASRFDRMQARKGNANSAEAVGKFPDQPDLEVMTQRAIDILSQNRNGFFLMVEGGSIDREYHRMDPHRAIFETIELDKAIGVARSWARQQGNETLILVTADHETSGMALRGVLENGRLNPRAFPNYTDTDRDGFPDDPLPSRSLAFDFASVFGPAAGNHYYEVPRNLINLNPDSPQAMPLPRAAGHTASDVFIGAAGPGSQLFGGVMDNTDVFFRMLRAVGYR